MAIGLGDVVRFSGSGPKGEIGRICKDNGISVCVQFKTSGCLRVGKRDLEPAKGDAPECSAKCKESC